jgi:hypothetical protein
MGRSTGSLLTSSPFSSKVLRLPEFAGDNTHLSHRRPNFSRRPAGAIVDFCFGRYWKILMPGRGTGPEEPAAGHTAHPAVPCITFLQILHKQHDCPVDGPAVATRQIFAGGGEFFPRRGNEFGSSKDRPPRGDARPGFGSGNPAIRRVVSGTCRRVPPPMCIPYITPSPNGRTEYRD